jgi:hypothetical protein
MTLHHSLRRAVTRRRATIGAPLVFVPRLLREDQLDESLRRRSRRSRTSRRLRRISVGPFRSAL